MCGGKLRRELFCMANTAVIAAMTGQKILGSRRPSSVCVSEEVKTSNNGKTIKEKTHAESVTIEYVSIIGVGDLGRLNWRERIDALDLLALYRNSRCLPVALNTLGRSDGRSAASHRRRPPPAQRCAGGDPRQNIARHSL